MFMQSVDYTGSNLLITQVSLVSPVIPSALYTTQRKHAYHLIPQDFYFRLCHTQLNQYEMNLIIIESTKDNLKYKSTQLHY